MLSDEQLWWRPNAESNSVGNLMLHLAGNVRQWIVSGVGGAEDDRDRDREFVTDREHRQTVIRTLRTAVDDACSVLSHVQGGRLEERLTVQGYDVAVLEAIFHVVEHFSYHTGQIAFVTKMLTASDLGFYRHLAHRHAETTP